MKNSTKIPELAALFQPSALGIGIYILVYILVLVPRIPLVHSVVNGISTEQFNGTWLYSVGHHINNFLALDSVGKAALFGFWLIVGVAVYAGVRVFSGGLEHLETGLSERHYVMPKGSNRNSELHGFIARTVFRIMAFITIIFYVRLMLHLYASWLVRNPGQVSISRHDFVVYGRLFAAVVLLLYGLTILIRLLLLKRRIFG